MNKRRLFLVAFPWILAACSPDATVGSATPTDDFVPVADVKEIMDAIIDPASDLYFAAVGVIVDEQGEHQLAPTTDEEWLALENAAYQITESGNLLLIGDRRRDNAAWVTMSQQLIDAGRRGVEAAKARNLDAIFDMGAEIYAVCTNCHAVYYIPFVDENGNVVR